ncbi:MAG: hypothetical protein DI586_04370 [Micavibrio aeruginosavorus]|uniref:Uncharacterized protein n=1 Tax=Micavibrio aeruginosavorus TaxID=349221 RepID=A0A2W5HKI6_9BACT|nr:MAG: hypothetical protein DI586_04370 [Micavibrio aeruginosavorus]
MSNNVYVPFFVATGRTLFNLHAIPETNLKSDYHLKPLKDHFGAATAQNAAALRIAAKDIGRDCAGRFSVAEENIEYPFTDPDSQRTYWPSLKLSFIGCEKNIPAAVSAWRINAEMPRPGFDDIGFWPGDFDVVGLGHDRREQNIFRRYGAPAGVIDKTNSVFVVMEDAHKNRITDFLLQPQI